MKSSRISEVGTRKDKNSNWKLDISCYLVLGIWDLFCCSNKLQIGYKFGDTLVKFHFVSYISHIRYAASHYSFLLPTSYFSLNQDHLFNILKFIFFKTVLSPCPIAILIFDTTHTHAMLFTEASYGYLYYIGKQSIIPDAVIFTLRS